MTMNEDKMTNYEEALRFFKGLCYRVPLKDADDAFCEIYDKNLKVIQQLVSKARPTKPDVERDGYADSEIVYDTWICPNCGKRFEIDYDTYTYCPNCGQALDWSDLQ